MAQHDLFNVAQQAYYALADFRERRKRLIDFAFGNQWIDSTFDFDNNTLSEAEFARLKGQNTVTINLLRRLIRTLIGKYRSTTSETYSTAETSTERLNSLAELDARLLEEYIISGCAIQRICNERRPAGTGVWIDNIDPDRFFVNQFYDSRGLDINLIGTVHEFTWSQFLNRFSNKNVQKASKLKAIFNSCAGRATTFTDQPQSVFTPVAQMQSDQLCRVIEVWTYEPSATKASATACQMEWHVRFFTDDGTMVHHRTSPYPHKAHPFVVKLYPLINGRVHSFIEDLIEPQKAINRLLSSFELSMATAAKGVLLFPQNQLVKPLNIDDVGRMWARHNSVIPIRGNGDMPVQLYSNPSTAGIIPLIEMQLHLFDEASGISAAIRGEQLSSSLSTETARTILANAEAGVADLLESFKAFIDTRNKKVKRT